LLKNKGRLCKAKRNEYNFIIKVVIVSLLNSRAGENERAAIIYVSTAHREERAKEVRAFTFVCGLLCYAVSNLDCTA